MDNRVFNINGSTKEMLKTVIALAFTQSGYSKCEGFVDSPKGLILLWSADSVKNASKFPSPLTPSAAADIVWEWLKSEPFIKLSGWDSATDHDGDNGDGWRVFCEDWGHVSSLWQAVVCITPAVMWYGK